MTLLPADLSNRKVWISPHLSCPTCGRRSYGVQSSDGAVVMACQSKRCDRTRWRAITVYPGTIGGALAYWCEWDFAHARVLIGQLFPETLAMGDDEVWALEIVPRAATEPLYLQVELTKREAAQDDGSVGRRMMKFLAAAL